MARQIPPAEDLLALFLAAVSNARGLLADADFLMDAGSAPRAHALAVFAAEELGKAKLCMIAFAVPGGADAKVFWDEFYTHETKLLRELGVQDLLLQEGVASMMEAISRLPSESQATHKRRVRGLFVDYRDGAILLPDEVSEQEARQVINDVRASLGVMDAVLKPPDALDQLRKLAGVEQTEFFRQALLLVAPDLDTDGWDAVSLYQQLARRVAADPEAAIRVFHELWREFRPPTEEPI
jgi:AbiV family abortive infection protein